MVSSIKLNRNLCKSLRSSCWRWTIPWILCELFADFWEALGLDSIEDCLPTDVEQGYFKAVHIRLFSRLSGPLTCLASLSPQHQLQLQLETRNERKLNTSAIRDRTLQTALGPRASSMARQVYISDHEKSQSSFRLNHLITSHSAVVHLLSSLTHLIISLSHSFAIFALIRLVLFNFRNHAVHLQHYYEPRARSCRFRCFRRGRGH